MSLVRGGVQTWVGTSTVVAPGGGARDSAVQKVTASEPSRLTRTRTWYCGNWPVVSKATASGVSAATSWLWPANT